LTIKKKFAGILPVGSEMNMLGEEGIVTKDGWIQYGDQKYSSFDLWFEAVSLIQKVICLHSLAHLGVPKNRLLAFKFQT